jgi:vacuolar-type H+-ATPase subunit F/Vma7
MVFIHIDTKNVEDKDEKGETQISKLNHLIHDKKDNKVFLLYYMEGCGPCNATRPEWSKLKNTLKHLEKRDDVAVVDIDQVLSSKIKGVKEPNSFPTIRYITDRGNFSENYEDSKLGDEEKNRSIDSFVKWINLNIGEKEKQGGGIIRKRNKSMKKHSKSKKNKTINKNKYSKKGGKWSAKYKKSINCNRPKGFSQKQHCKYGRKHA